MEIKNVKLKIKQKYYCCICKRFIAKKREDAVTELEDSCKGVSAIPGVGVKTSCKCGKIYLFLY